MDIQRIPFGFSQLISSFGGAAPRTLNDEARAVVDLLQMFGLAQRQVLTSAPTAPVLGAAQQTVMSDRWTVLYALHGIFAKTATQTALRGRLGIARGGVGANQVIWIFEAELGPYGATTAGTGEIGGVLPYPLICPPGTTLYVGPSVLGTDVSVNVQVQAEFGTLG